MYTAGSQSLAILEILLHLETSEPLDGYSFFSVQFDAAHLEEIEPGTLPKNWRSYPPPRKMQEIGDAWATKDATPVLRVPSAIVPAESNYLLNPAHSGFAGLTIAGPIPYRSDYRFG